MTASYQLGLEYAIRMIGGKRHQRELYSYRGACTAEELKELDEFGTTLQTIGIPYEVYGDEYILFHHRKTSVGKTSTENIHPFPLFGGRFLLMQNGSAREIHGWGVLNFEEGDTERSDTYYLGRFIEQRNADNFIGMVDIMNELINKKISLGVIVIYDVEKRKFLLLSDGDRSMRIVYDADSIGDDLIPTKIDYFSSIDDEGSDEYSFYGWIEADMEGNILAQKLSYVNKFVEKKKYTQTTTAASTTGTTRSTYASTTAGTGTTRHVLLPPCVASLSEQQGGKGCTTGRNVQRIPFDDGWAEKEEEIGTYSEAGEASSDGYEDSDLEWNRLLLSGTTTPNDYVDLNIEDVMIDDEITTLIERFYKLYEDCQQRIIRQSSDDGIDYKGVINALSVSIGETQCKILDLMENRKKSYLNGFERKDTAKYRYDKEQIEDYIADTEARLDELHSYII